MKSDILKRLASFEAICSRALIILLCPALLLTGSCFIWDTDDDDRRYRKYHDRDGYYYDRDGYYYDRDGYYHDHDRERHEKHERHEEREHEH